MEIDDGHEFLEFLEIVMEIDEGHEFLEFWNGN
jgi:hypothetical protein